MTDHCTTDLRILDFHLLRTITASNQFVDLETEIDGLLDKKIKDT